MVGKPKRATEVGVGKLTRVNGAAVACPASPSERLAVYGRDHRFTISPYSRRLQTSAPHPRSLTVDVIVINPLPLSAPSSRHSRETTVIFSSPPSGISISSRRNVVVRLFETELPNFDASRSNAK